MHRPHGISSATRLLSLLGALLWMGLTANAQPTSQRYLIEFREFGPAAAALVRAEGGSPVHEFPAHRTIAAWLPEQARLALANRPDIVRIERDAERYPLAQTTPYGIAMVQANDPVVALSGAPTAMVCVIDSGYDFDHPDLPGATGTPPSGDSDSGAGSWSTDRCGHGTHVAGTIAALSNATGVVGVLPGGNLPLHIVKVFGDSCDWAYSSDLVAALNKCTAANAKVVSMSLGGPLPTAIEEAAFNAAHNAGVLSIAAAGNGGNTATSYPAGYASVMSVGAVDSNGTVAGFSQQNSDVEIVAPGVGVLSTVPWTNENSVTVDGSTIFGNWIENAGRHEGVTGGLVNGGLCDLPGGWDGKVVVCERGNITFFQKVTNVQASGGVAAVVYNNIPGTFIGTLGDGNTSVIPAISLSQDEGQWLVANKLGMPGTVVSWIDDNTDGYEAWDGTSMATPHVSGVAALLWSHRSGWTNAQIRAALQQTAMDLGAPGVDAAYGFGLVQAKNAFLLATPPPAPASVVLSAQGSKVKGRKQTSLSWTGGPSLVSVFRSGVRIAAAIPNTGAYVDAPPTKGNSFVYTVCEAHGVTCSNSVVVTF
jgi:serine protease